MKIIPTYSTSDHRFGRFGWFGCFMLGRSLGLLWLLAVSALAQTQVLNVSGFIGEENEYDDWTFTAPATGTISYSWSADGLPLNVSGPENVTGGQYCSVSVSMSDSYSGHYTLTATFIPGGPLPSITSATTAGASPGVAFTYTITGSNSPTGFGATGLPAGLSINSSGVISGTPTTTGTSSVGLAASNQYGTGTGTLTLTVAPGAAPSIVGQPQAQTAVAGSGITFSVTVGGNPTPTGFQWRKNGTNISGATSATLAISSVQSGDAASYDVLVSGLGIPGNLTSNTATLTVTDPPPSAPTSLNYVEKTETTVTLLWSPSYDNVAVVNYAVFRGTTQIGTTTDVVFADSGLTASTAYSYTVKAIDTASQSSSASNTLNVTTNASSSADSDHDGIPNLAENALGTSSSVAATAATGSQTQQVIHRPLQ